MRLNRFIIAISLLLAAQGAQGAWANETVLKAIPNALPVGEGKLSVAFWDVYDATLYAPEGTWTPSRPYALSLRYFRDIKGRDIADRSVQEIRGQGFNDEVKLAAWNAQLKSIFPDVQPGSVLSAVFIPGKHTQFFNNGAPIGTIKGDEFANHFAGIWLSEKTSEPALRKQLLGLK
jgi:hypothetical protein